MRHRIPSLALALSISLLGALPLAGWGEPVKSAPGFWDDSLTKAKSGTWFWDGGLTNAKSGVEADLYDPNDSTGKSGVKPPHQWFFIPPERYYENVDPNEIADTRKKDYVPYAVALFTQNVAYRGVIISKGYYQVKLGAATGGSPKTNLTAMAEKANDPAFKPQSTQNFYPNGLPQLAPPDAPPPEEAPAPPPEPTQTFILKKLGNVVAVLPVEKVEPYKRPKGEKKSKQPLAKVFLENQVPVLKLLYKDKLYTTILSY